jgi:hypothetical protein
MLQLDARAHREQFRGQMIATALRGGGVVDFAGARPGERNELHERLDRQCGMNDQHVVAAVDRGDRREILDGIVGRAHQERRDDVRARRDHDRIAVGRRLEQRACADDRAGAAAVVDECLHAERFGQLAPDHAGEDVVARTGRERHDDADRLGRIGRLRMTAQRHDDAEGKDGNAQLPRDCRCETSHGLSS